MSIIHITDQQFGRILDDITANNILSNNHHQSLKDNLETFNFTTFADRPFSQYLSKRNRVIIPGEDGEYIEFIIDEAFESHDSQGLQMKVYTHASYLDLKKAKVIFPTTLTEYTPSTAVSFTIGGTEWRAGIIQGTGFRTFVIDKHTNPFAFLKVIAKEFGLELRFRIVTDGNKVTRYVDLLERFGEWRGREVEFGRDLIGISRIEKQDIYTALVGLGPIQEEDTQMEVLVEDEEALQRWGRPHPVTGELQHLIGTYEPQVFDENMTLERLRQLTKTELDKRIKEAVEYEADIVDLENVPGMENKKIRFGDTIKIKDTKFNPPLYLEARVYTQDRSIVDKSKKRVTLGDYIEYTEEEVNAIWKSLQFEIQKKVSMSQVMAVTYDQNTIDTKVEPGNAAKEKLDTDVGVAIIETTTGSQNKADTAASQAEINAKNYTDLNAVSQTTYNAKVQELTNSIAEKVDGEWVNGQLATKADANSVYTIAQVDGMFDNVVSITQYSTDKQGFVDRFESNESAISQNTSEIQSRVTSTQLTAAIADIEVGGRNLSENTKRRELLPRNTGASSDNYNYERYYSTDGLIDGKEYTFSARIEITEGSFNSVTLLAYPSGGRVDAIMDANGFVQFTFLATATTDSVLVYAGLSSATRGNGIIIHEAKLEKGNKATDWTPAPEDTDARITSSESQITQLAGEISSKVSNTDYNGNTIATLINQSATTILLSAERVDLQGYVTATDLVVDGNLKFGGVLEGATGVFKGSVQAAKLVVENPNLVQEGSVGLSLELAQWQASETQPFVKTGNVIFNTGANGLEIYKENLDGTTGFMDFLDVHANGFRIYGHMYVEDGGDIHGGGTFRFIGSNQATIRAEGSHVFLQSPTEVRATKPGTLADYIPIKAQNIDVHTVYSGNIVQNAGNYIYLGANNEVRVTDTNTYNGINYKPIRASSFPTGTSLRENKTDIEVYTADVLSVIRDANPYLYRIKGEEYNEHKQLGLMVDETPRELHGEGGDSMEIYALATFLFRGIKQLDESTNKRIMDIEVENKMLKERVRQLEAKVA